MELSCQSYQLHSALSEIVSLVHCDYEPREYNITNKFYAELIQFWTEFRNAFSTEDDSTSIIWNVQ